MQRFVLPTVLLTDVNPHELGFALNLERAIRLWLRLDFARTSRFDDLGVVNINQPGSHHFKQFGQKGVDLFRCFDEFNFDRKIFSQPEDASRVEVLVRAKPRHAANHRCAGNTPVKQKVKNGRIDRMAVVLAVLTYVYADLFCRTLFKHHASKSYKPRWDTKTSCDIPPGNYAQPHCHESYDNAEHHV